MSSVSVAEHAGSGAGAGGSDIAALIPIVRRIVVARLGSHPAADDLVQETLTRVLAACATIEPGMLEPYAIVTARNVVASMWRDDDRKRRNLHRIIDLSAPEPPETQISSTKSSRRWPPRPPTLASVSAAPCWSTRSPVTIRRSLAERSGSTAGAVAAQLNRSRARLRVEYLLALRAREPPTERCRPVLLALCSGDQRRQREVARPSTCWSASCARD